MNKVQNLETLPENINTIFWIRHESFENRNSNYFELNVLLDGALETIYAKIQSQGSSDQWLQNIYLTGKNFDQPIHLFILNATQFRIKTELESIRSLLKPKFNASDSIELLIIDETDSFREEYFKLSQPVTNFHYLH